MKFIAVEAHRFVAGVIASSYIVMKLYHLLSVGCLDFGLLPAKVAGSDTASRKRHDQRANALNRMHNENAAGSVPIDHYDEKEDAKFWESYLGQYNQRPVKALQMSVPPIPIAASERSR